MPHELPFIHLDIKYAFNTAALLPQDLFVL